MILGIESSCDDSALALFDPVTGGKGHWMSSQVALHEQYGGVVPDLASREHLANLPAMLRLLQEPLGGASPDTIFYTAGPGLAPCLAMGKTLAQALASCWECPAYGVNHLRAHAYSPFGDFFQDSPGDFSTRVEKLLPHLGLLASGGNTLLYEITAIGTIKILAETRDDAAGEAIDKGAKLLGLPYPGGPHIERLAENGDSAYHQFPIGQNRQQDMFFSFSGLKTSLRYYLETQPEETVRQNLSHLCASYQEAVVQGLALRIKQAIRRNRGFQSLGLCGGVAQNRRLRKVMADIAENASLPFLVARKEYCGDNAAMIAFAGLLERAALHENAPVRPSLSLTEQSLPKGHR
ncbi:MAG: tRNA (adenosine(37)-N6)-threonylcarbamoyltransferase complex transferase subunit TsaD [Opitutales bacterium]|nr:tRNA (adenosine(37)-N6)-threonylcarbamoyltransferase complex transferase subunit TsaD [Opitutales bacterium]